MIVDSKTFTPKFYPQSRILIVRPYDQKKITKNSLVFGKLPHIFQMQRMYFLTNKRPNFFLNTSFRRMQDSTFPNAFKILNKKVYFKNYVLMSSQCMHW